MKTYSVTMTVEIEADNEHDAILQANALDDTCIVESVTCIDSDESEAN